MQKKLEGKDIIQFWFNEINSDQWFKKDSTFDDYLRLRFGGAVRRALNGDLDLWSKTDEGCLALILLLDQFTRNIYRGNPKAYSGDEMALALSFHSVKHGFIKHPNEVYRRFMLMPMMHSEDFCVQKSSLVLFYEHTNRETHSYAKKHFDIIDKFGRFPHRNSILGRPSSVEEEEFLTGPNSAF